MRDHAQWGQLVGSMTRAALRGSALAPVLGAPPAERLRFAQAFADDAGHRRAIDPPLLAWVLKLDPWIAPQAGRVDIALWDALHQDGADPLGLAGSGLGPVSPVSASDGIEVWTEIELASLHALWWHARLRQRPEIAERARSLARWLMAELQPDNGTNRPWAVAAFAELAAEGDTDADLYAGTLLHNCQVSLGRPDAFSTVLLLDATTALVGRRGLLAP